jgi:N-acetylglucosaminyldiphosphoundecaprenol N-acetyl-beta-D-mannosaminyltransferase
MTKLVNDKHDRQSPAKTVFFGVRLDKLTQKELIANMIDMAGSGKSIIAYANIKTMNLAYEQPWFAHFLNSANIVYCDGFGVVLAAKLAGRSIQNAHRATCPDWLETLAGECAANGRSLFLLAGCDETAEIAKQRLTKTFPTLKLGVYQGYFQKTGSENERVIQAINAFQPDILGIGFGTPLQEQWIEQNYHKINTHVFLPVGACLDYYTGLRSRGPAWLTNHGFEWLCRLVSEPRRLWHRYIVGIPLFIFRVIRIRFFPRKQPAQPQETSNFQSRSSGYVEQDN